MHACVHIPAAEMNIVIKLSVMGDQIELDEYTDDVTIDDLAKAVDSFRLHHLQSQGLKTRNCCGCGICCHDLIPVLGMDLAAFGYQPGRGDEPLRNQLVLPRHPDIQQRSKDIRETMAQFGISEPEATFLYDVNQAEPLALPRRDDGGCRYLQGNLCGIYEKRPFNCRFYLCNMGTRLAAIQETLVSQGTWHAYAMLGWIPAKALRYNPFMRTQDYSAISLADLEFNLDKNVEKMFFYF